MSDNKSHDDAMTIAVKQLTSEERVIASVRALRAAQRVDVLTLSARLGISRATWYERMADGNFTIGQIISLASMFGVSVQTIVDGVGLEPSRASIAPKFRAIKGEGRDPQPRTPLLTLV